MRSRSRACLLALPLAMLVAARSGAAAGPPKRRPLDAKQREAVLALLKAVDLAQDVGVLADAGLAWENPVL